MTEPKYAIIELMGHNVIAGEMEEVTLGGASMLKITTPRIAEEETFLENGGYFEGSYYSAGVAVRISGDEPHEFYVQPGANSVYRISIVTAEQAAARWNDTRGNKETTLVEPVAPTLSGVANQAIAKANIRHLERVRDHGMSFQGLPIREVPAEGGLIGGLEINRSWIEEIKPVTEEIYDKAKGMAPYPAPSQESEPDDDSHPGYEVAL